MHLATCPVAQVEEKPNVTRSPRYAGGSGEADEEAETLQSSCMVFYVHICVYASVYMFVLMHGCMDGWMDG